MATVALDTTLFAEAVRALVVAFAGVVACTRRGAFVRAQPDRKLALVAWISRRWKQCVRDFNWRTGITSAFDGLLIFGTALNERFALS